MNLIAWWKVYRERKRQYSQMVRLSLTSYGCENVAPEHQYAVRHLLRNERFRIRIPVFDTIAMWVLPMEEEPHEFASVREVTYDVRMFSLARVIPENIYREIQSYFGGTFITEFEMAKRASGAVFSDEPPRITERRVSYPHALKLNRWERAIDWILLRGSAA